MNSIRFSLSLFLLFNFTIIGFTQNQEPYNKKPFSIGDQIQFESKFLLESRTLNIYLPEAYSEEKKYPVIYLLDGSADEDFIHIAGLVQFGSFPWIDMLPQSIVVGISNIDRKRDFTYPSTVALDQTELPTSGGSDAFIQFLLEEVQVLINQEYSTDSTSTLIGQSLGGLLATQVLFKHPNQFDHFIIVSPSLWWDDNSLLNAKLNDTHHKPNIFVAVGKEGAQMETLTMDLYSKLVKNRRSQKGLFFHFLENRDHGDALHLAVYKAFENIYRKESKD